MKKIRNAKPERRQVSVRTMLLGDQHPGLPDTYGPKSKFFDDGRQPDRNAGDASDRLDERPRVEVASSAPEPGCREIPADALVRKVRQSREIALNVLLRQVLRVCILPDPEKLAPGPGGCHVVSRRAFCACQTQQGFGSMRSALQ